MSQSFFHLVFAISFTVFTLIRMYSHRQARKHAGKFEYKEGKSNQIVRALIGFPFILGLFAYMFYPPLLNWAAFSLPAWAQWTGVGLSVVSLALLVWIQRSLGHNFNTTLHIREEHTLVTHGPYNWVRHPMYTTLVLFEVSLLLLTANWFIGGVLLIAQIIVILARVNNEERVLLEKFGEQYRQYMQRAGRFLPKITSRRKTETAIN